MSDHGYGCECDSCRGGSRVNGVMMYPTTCRCGQRCESAWDDVCAWCRGAEDRKLAAEVKLEKHTAPAEPDDWKEDPRTFTLAEYLEMPVSEVSDFIRSRFRP